MRQVIAAVVVLASASLARADGRWWGGADGRDRGVRGGHPSDGGFVRVGRDVYAVTPAFVLPDSGCTYIQFDAPDGTFLPGTLLVVSPEGALSGRIADASGQLVTTLEGSAVVR
jgi:hypothetical protein